MGVIGVSNESPHMKRRSPGDNSETDSVVSDEETRLLITGAKTLKEEATQKEKYPKAVFFILGNEFCERFCYYGMRTILTIYLTEELLYSDNKATLIFHASIMLTYFTPLFGALLADSWLGKFRTILYVSIIYAIGNVILSVGSIPHALSTMKGVSLLGLLIIAIGTGGIKPCVSAFGGDQFSNTQEKQRQKFFSIFYFAINSGSVLSTVLTPILRADVHCFGTKSCYPLAFGVPAILMIVALVLFLLGKPLYKIQPSKGNIFASVSKCICHAIAKKTKSKEKKREHWLEYADDKFEKPFIKDIRTLLYVLWIFIPLPVFWALFDQTGSSWTLQATKMNREVLGYHMKPDQMQVMNAIMIIILIPVFDYAIYPLFSKCNLLKKPLQRIAVGGFLSAIAFVTTGLVELKLESGFPILPEIGFTDLTVINNSPCNIKIVMPESQEVNLKAFEISVLTNLPMDKESSWEIFPTECTATRSVVWQFKTSSPIESMMITLQNKELFISKGEDSKTRTDDGEPKFRIFYSTDYEVSPHKNSSFKVNEKIFLFPNSTEEPTKFGMTDYQKIEPGKHKIYFPVNETAYQNPATGEVEFKYGGIYIVTIYQNIPDNKTNFMVHIVEKPNSVSILYQIPSYLILTAGEIMFSITGLEFSYSQAPQSMKSIVQAAWLLTVAFGNLIVMIIAKLSLFEKKSHEIFMFAILMGLDMVLFSIMAYYYKYVDSENESTSKSAATKTKGKENYGYEEEETNFNK